MEKLLHTVLMKVDSTMRKSGEGREMNLVVTTTTPDGKEKVEVDVRELTLRLQSLTNGCNMEIIQLAIFSMLDERKDAVETES